MGDSKELRLRRQRLILRSMENMGAFDRNKIQRKEAPIPAAQPSQATQTQPSRPPTAAASSDAQLASQIEARFAAAQKETPFETLGLGKNATKEQVKRSFLALVKTFHPDRLPSSLSHLAKKICVVFESIHKAYETLYDDAKRTAYLAQQPSASKQFSASQTNPETSIDMARGEAYFQKRDYRQAEIHFQKAYAQNKSAASLAAVAWSIYVDSTRSTEKSKAQAMMEEALKIDATCTAAHYQLGVIARVKGDMRKAEDYLTLALKSNPQHREATRELKTIQMFKRRKTKTP